jgi:hypothetical protein
MLSFTGSLRIFVALEACDMRMGYNGLCGLVAGRLQEDIRSGALFVFGNRRRTRIKIWPYSGKDQLPNSCGKHVVVDQGVEFSKGQRTIALSTPPLGPFRKPAQREKVSNSSRLRPLVSGTSNQTKAVVRTQSPPKSQKTLWE